MTDISIQQEDIEPAEFKTFDTETDRNRARDKAQLENVLNVLETLNSNGVEDEERLESFGTRMANLIYYGGMKPSEAKARAIREQFSARNTYADYAKLLGMTKGGFASINSKSSSRTEGSHRLHYMTFNVPLNVMFHDTLRAEPPADYETTYYIMDVVGAREEGQERTEMGRHGPISRYEPAEPQYAVITETHIPTPGDWSADEIRERDFGPFSDMEILWMMDEGEVVEELYEDRYFETEDRAEFWEETLSDLGFEDAIVSEPADRINPDAMVE